MKFKINHPTEPGWYWAKFNEKKIEPVHLYIGQEYSCGSYYRVEIFGNSYHFSVNHPYFHDELCLGWNLQWGDRIEVPSK